MDNVKVEALKACELLIKYDEGDQQDSVQLMFDYANATRAARKALRARELAHAEQEKQE